MKHVFLLQKSPMRCTKDLYNTRLPWHNCYQLIPLELLPIKRLLTYKRHVKKSTQIAWCLLLCILTCVIVFTEQNEMIIASQLILNLQTYLWKYFKLITLRQACKSKATASYFVHNKAVDNLPDLCKILLILSLDFEKKFLPFLEARFPAISRFRDTFLVDSASCKSSIISKSMICNSLLMTITA